MIVNDAEYKELVKKKYNELATVKNPWSFQVWKAAFAEGFKAARTPEEDERLKEESLEKHGLEIEEVRW